MPREEAIAAARAAARRSRSRPLGRKPESGSGADRESGTPGEEGWGDARTWVRNPERPGSPAQLSGPVESGAAAEARRVRERAVDVPEPAVGGWRARAALAVRERLPLWLQLRCGMELRTLLALAVVLLVAVGFAVHHFWTGRPESVAAPTGVGPVPETAATGGPGPTGSPSAGEAGAAAGPGAGGVAGASSGKRLVIDVSGKVREPGVYRLPSGSRVADALRKAGGLRAGAETDGLNRARVLVDGEQIVVGAKGKGAAGAAPAAPAPPGAGAASGSASGGSSGAGGTAPGAPVSLSSATLEQLDTLPGVGPVLAQHIIDYRTEHGGFTSVDQLREVNGIGDRRFADLQAQVTP